MTLAALAALAGCRTKESGPVFEDFFERTGVLRVVPIDPFRRIPGSLVALPDGRFVLPETEGVWIHVVGPEGEGLTRIGGESPEPLGTSAAPPGKFHSLSGVALMEDGRLLAADRTSDVVSVFNRDLEPEGVLKVPRARSVWQIEALPGGRFAAAVSPRHPTADGQIVIFAPGDSARGYLPQEPIFRHNRWQTISSTRLEALPDGRILAYWSPFPWARLITAAGDSLPRLGKLSARYKAPSSGPREGAPLEDLRSWYASFTPLAGVEVADSMLVFQFLDRGALPDSAATGRGDAEARENTASAQGTTAQARARGAFVNLYDEAGLQLAADILLPPGSRILKSNDPSRLYVLTKASPRELEIELWRPTAERPAPPAR